MPYIDDKKFDALAKEAVAKFINDNIPLNDSVYKLASEEGMLPDQVKQLVWRTNTLTHLTLFEKKAEDKNIVFPVADADVVLKRLYKESPEKTATAYTQRIKEKEVDYFSSLLFNETEKTASAHDHTYIPPFDNNITTNHKDKIYDSINLLHKVGHELVTKMNENKFMYLEKLSELGNKLRKIYSEPDGVAKLATYAHEIVTRHGNDGKQILRNLNIPVNPEFTKHAALADSDDPIHSLCDEVIKLRNTTIKYAKARALLQDKIQNK